MRTFRFLSSWPGKGRANGRRTSPNQPEDLPDLQDMLVAITSTLLSEIQTLTEGMTKELMSNTHAQLAQSSPKASRYPKCLCLNNLFFVAEGR